MNKKLMLLATGALAALAFAALPAVASAGEYEFHCEKGAQCNGTITGGAAALANTGGDTISCTSVTGTSVGTSTTTTTTVELTFHGCRETVTFFKFSCSNTATPGTITTNEMPGHLVNLVHGGTAPGILLTGVNVTFTCAGFSNKTVTGNVIGTFEDPSSFCNKYVSSHKLTFEQNSHGVQKHTQVTSTGTAFDLISNGDDGGSYLTSSQTGTGTVAYTNNKVNITC